MIITEESSKIVNFMILDQVLFSRAYFYSCSVNCILKHRSHKTVLLTIWSTKIMFSSARMWPISL